MDAINSSISGSDQILAASLSKRSVVATVKIRSVYAYGVSIMSGGEGSTRQGGLAALGLRQFNQLQANFLERLRRQQQELM